VSPLARPKERNWLVGLAVVLVAAIGAGVFFYMHRPRRLTEKDSILLADFVNTTGEPVLTVR
jgi:hypothetical protein